MVNRVGERILPCGTPSSCGFSEKRVLSRRTLNVLPFKKFSINKGNQAHLVEIFYDTTLPGAIMGLFQIQKYSSCMLIFNKTLTDISLQSDKLVCGTFAFLKTTLIFSYYIIVLQEPCKTMIYHALHCWKDNWSMQLACDYQDPFGLFSERQP